MFGDPRPRVVPPEAHDRPPVVASGGDDVDLVAAVRTVLVLPDRAAHRMNDEPERIAMAERVNLRPVPLTAGERIVRRNRSVLVEAQELAAQAGGILRDLADVAAGREVNFAVAPEDHPAIETGV